MPNRSQHRTKAAKNRAFLDTLTVTDHSDWVAVAAFYTAVHLVEMLRAADGSHSENHMQRLEYVQSSHRAIHAPYRAIYNLSLVARYDSSARFYAAIDPGAVDSLVVGTWLAEIEAYIAADEAVPGAGTM